MNDLRFRHELKYLVPLDQGEDFLNSIKKFCTLDKHAGYLDAYEVASIYYDTDDFRFYRDREESVGYRRKVRLRTYNHSSAPPIIFLEIKEKHKHLVAKKKVILSNDLLLAEGVPHLALTLDSILTQAQACAAKSEIIYLNNYFPLYPIVNVRYIRKAYSAITEPELRITLDQRLTTGGISLVNFEAKKEKFFIPENLSVLEVKSNMNIPLWLQSELARFSFRQLRVSKYCLAVQNLGIGDKNLAFNIKDLRNLSDLFVQKGKYGSEI